MSCKSWDSYSDNNKSKPKRPKEKKIMTDKQQRYEQALVKIRQLLSDALDSDVTSADESIDNMYEALELCDVLDE